MAHGVFLVVDSSFLDTTFDQAENCPDHQKERTLFCTKHKQLCCVACAFYTGQQHSSCKNDMNYISEVYKDFASSEEYKKLVERIQNIARLVTQCQADIPRCKDAVDKLSKTEIEIFRIYKAEIVAYLDKRETELLTEIKQRRDKDISILQTLKAHSESI